jgi:hypothetical protein
MKLPNQIPNPLRKLAFLLPEFDDGEGAWFKVDAIAVIESLKGTTMPISNVIILNAAPGGYIPSESRLKVGRFPNEGDSDYADRSHSLALDFIRISGVVDDKTLFVFTFPLWKDAA